MNFPSLSQWKQLNRVLNKKEKIILLILFFFFVFSLSFLTINFYLSKTKRVPAFGGKITIGVVGKPSFLNPIYAILNDVDRDLVQLMFAGLMKYTEKGEIKEDLCKSFTIGEEGKVYNFYLKENIFWSDGKEITADDIVFTIKVIQDPKYKSPLRPQWSGIEVEKLSKKAVRFKLKKRYHAFLETATLKIIPKHIFENISPESFPLTAFNLQPITSGPYKFKEIKLNKLGFIESITIERFKKYFGKKPYISEITFLFFEKENDLLKAAKKKKIDLFSLSFLKNDFKKDIKSFQLKKLILPRYFAIFFHQQKNELLKKKKIREALAFSTNKREIISKVLSGEGKIVNSPLLPDFYSLSLPNVFYEYNPQKAKEIFKNLGFLDKDNDGYLEKIIFEEREFSFKKDLKKGDKGENIKRLQECLSSLPDIYPEGQITGYFGEKTKKAVIAFQEKYKEEILKPVGLEKGTGKVGPLTREKLNELCFPKKEKIIPLSFNLITVEDPQLSKVAELIKEQWKKVGVKLNIFLLPSNVLEQEYLKERNYEILLFGELLGEIPDPFPFWHSSQKIYPGLNLSSYQNKKADKILEEIRLSFDEKERKEKYEKLQDIILEDLPAVFLYSPYYLFFVSKDLKGVSIKKIKEPSLRFIQVENWYLKTKRVLRW